MTTQISEANFQPATLDLLGSGPRITGVVVTNSGWTPTGASTVSSSGGFVVVSGTGFQTGVQVIFDETPATAVSLVNSQTLRVTVPALAVGSRFVYVVNTDGRTGLRTNSLVVA